MNQLWLIQKTMIQEDSVMDTNPYVYLIGWTKLDTWYCGASWRKGCHPSKLWTKYFTSSKYVKAFREENSEPDHIEILKEFTNKEDTIAFEIEKIIEFDAIRKSNWLNKNIGGKYFSGRMPGFTHSVKFREYMSIIQKTRIRKPWTEEQKRKMSEIKKNMSIQTRQRISEAQLGKKRHPLSNDIKLKISNGNKGVKRSEETRKRISQAKKNMSEDTRRKMSDAAKARKYKNLEAQGVR